MDVEDGGNFPASGLHSGPFLVTVNLKGKALESACLLPRAFCVCVYLYTLSLNLVPFNIIGRDAFIKVKNRAWYVPSVGQKISICFNYITEKGHSSGSSQNKEGDTQVHCSFLLRQKKPPAILKW